MHGVPMAVFGDDVGLLSADDGASSLLNGSLHLLLTF
jgi:hypothetical protein